MKQRTVILLTMTCLLFVQLCCVGDAAAGKKIFFINSYHSGYAWSDGIGKGIKDILNGTGIELKTYDMDTKRNTSDKLNQ